MNVVDLRYQIKVVVPIYKTVRQPMISYTSIKEFSTAVKAEGKKIILVKDAAELFGRVAEVIKKLKVINKDIYPANQKDFVIADYNVWIATGEKFIPLVTDMYLNTIYKTDNDGNKFPTDNTFIKINAVKALSNTMVCYTSSGIFNISFLTWDFTAAIRSDFNQTTRKKIVKVTYDERLQALLLKKKPMMRDALLFTNLINPMSSTYLDPEASVKKVYPEIRKADRGKVLQSERFKLFFMKQLGALMPDLLAGIRKHNDPEAIGKYLEDMRQKALTDGTTDDQIKAMAVTLKLAYGESLLQGSNPFQAEHNAPNMPYVTEGDEQVNRLPAAEVVEDAVLEPYNDEKDIQAAIAQIDDSEMDMLMEETGTPDGYVQDELVKPKADGKGV